MEIILALAALTILAMVVSYFYLTRDDRALLHEQDTLPEALRVGPLPLTAPPLPTRQDNDVPHAA